MTGCEKKNKRSAPAKDVVSDGVVRPVLTLADFGPPPMPKWEELKRAVRAFMPWGSRLVKVRPTIGIIPVADGRPGAYEDNVARTWIMVQKVYELILKNVRLPDGMPPYIVVAPEIVYGARTGAACQVYFQKMGVSSVIWVSRSWAYSDELMAACIGIGSSEWQQAAYGLNQTDRPGAVWLKAFTAAMDEKRRPIFSIYSPNLEDEEGPLNDYVATRIVRFARCAATVAALRGSNYLEVGGVSMGIIGSDNVRNPVGQQFGMGIASFDMVGLQTLKKRRFYDHEAVDAAVRHTQANHKINPGSGTRPLPLPDLLRECAIQTVMVRDLMIGNGKLADPVYAKKHGFKPDVELAQGCNAIAAGTQGQRQHTDGYPNFDFTEAVLCSSWDWDGPRQPFINATENDGKNGLGMCIAHHLSGGLAQLFADIRTNWDPESIKKATGISVKRVAPGGVIDKRNSGAGALDYAVNPYEVIGLDPEDTTAQQLAARLQDDKSAHAALIKAAQAATVWEGANLTYFPGDGLSSSYSTPGTFPMTAYRLNCVGSMWTLSVVEGDVVQLPAKVVTHISRVTDATWPESYWAPRGMSSFDYMRRIGPNHDANSFGLIGADWITLAAMLRIPVDMHNVPAEQIFRPTIWERFGGDDFRVCEKLGPLYV